MKLNRHLILPAIVMLLSACSDVVSGIPSTDKVKADLIGRSACNWAFNSINEFRKLKIVDQTTSSEIAEYELEIEVEVGSDDRIMTARAIYKKQSGYWVLTKLNTMGCTSTKKITEQNLLDEAQNLYTNNDDGTITDKQTGLMWKQCVEGLSGSRCHMGKVLYLEWQTAIDRGESAEFAGYSDWHLPSKEELITLVDKRFKPTIHPSSFPNMPKSGSWSASPDPSYSSAAWSVDFSYGSPNNYGRNLHLPVRLVRIGQ